MRYPVGVIHAKLITLMKTSAQTFAGKLREQVSFFTNGSPIMRYMLSASVIMCVVVWGMLVRDLAAGEFVSLRSLNAKVVELTREANALKAELSALKREAER
jgi:hypothetical protein